MYEITNFAHSLDPNAAYTRFRDVSARDWQDLRVTEQGHLEVRKNHIELYDDKAVKQIFVYKNLLIAVIEESLMWARIKDEEDSIEFNHFDPQVNINASKYFQFQTMEVIDEEYIVVANGTDTELKQNGSPYIVILKDVFKATEPADPSIIRPVLHAPTNLSALASGGTDDEGFSRQSVFLRVQAIRTDGTQVGLPTYDYYDHNYTGVPEPPELAPRILISKPSNAVLVEISTGDIEVLIGAQEKRDAHTIGTLYITNPDNEFADYIDIYRTRRLTDDDFPVGDFEELTYYWIARIPYRTIKHGQFFEYTFRLDDDNLNGADTLDEVGDPINIQYMDADNVRIYASQPDSDKLYLSYFDGISKRYFWNFTDYIDLNLGGEAITGIKFLPETQWIAVYTASQIVLVYADPNPELCRVVGRYGSLDTDEAVGCIAPQSLVGIGRHHYFLGGNKRVYSFSGRQPNWLSSKVQPILRSIIIPEQDNEFFNPVNAHGVAFEGNYYLSIPSEGPLPDPIGWNNRDLGWKDGDIEWRQYPSPVMIRWRGQNIKISDEDVKWKANTNDPNTTLILDTERMLWYSDGFGIVSPIKNATGRFMGIINGVIYALYESDNSDGIRWLWRSNFLRLPVQELIHNVSVKTMDATDFDIEVNVVTDEGTARRLLEIKDDNDYWSQRAGVNLRGRNLDITISGRSPVTIDRISINERVRRINRR